MLNERLPFLREKTAVLTTSPGCYIMKDKSGYIIYIGKAKNLRNRVTSYFRESSDHLPKVEKMVSHVYDYDFIVTDTEFEALVLECSLIKQHKPKYNILLKDDKGYSYIKISNEKYPRITAELQKKTDGNFLGPYMSSFTTKQTVNEANKVFKLPTCSRKFPQEFGKQRPCLNYFIKQCTGICKGETTEEDYIATLNQAIEYIKSGSATSIDNLTKSMEIASENLNFELAAQLRDRINAIKSSQDSQKIIEINHKNTDVIALARNSQIGVASMLMYRQGKLFDKVDLMLGENDENNTTYEEIITQFYATREEIPREILLDEDIENALMLEKYLREKSNHAVTVLTPKRGASLKLTMLAKNNASEYLAIKVGRTGREIVALDELAKLLGMEKPPKYIECYDISNLASSAMVAGMVVFENGRPLKKAYKRFSIKEVEIQNDYASMQEVLERRFKRYFEGDDDGFSQLPDLILLDGGKGHVNAVTPVVRNLGINVPIFGLVKDNKHRTRAIASGGSEISITQTKSAFMLLTQIQDEVHRFAITYMKSVHNKKSYELELTKIKGIGIKKAQKLMIYFKTKEALKNADAQKLSQVAGINLQLAEELFDFIQDI